MIASSQMPITTRMSVTIAISRRPKANTTRMIFGAMKVSNDRKSHMAGSPLFA
jgi:hypothetical protein